MKILLTGATGFVGKALVEALQFDSHELKAFVRKFSTTIPEALEQNVIGDLAAVCSADNDNALIDNEHHSDVHNGDTLTDRYLQALKGIEIVVHSAARVHVMHDRVADPMAEFRRVNTQATISLARKAAKAGVKRFIFLSTIKVNGEVTQSGAAFTEQDACHPTAPYAVSKWEAEQALMELANETGMEVVIIRPPLVYGPGVKGNFASMMRWVHRGIPLPLGAVKNKRSLLALDNLVNFIICCMNHPKAANQVFLLSDGDDVSMPELIQKLAHSQGVRARLLSIPVSWMRFVFSLLGKRVAADRLFGSLQVDSRKAREYLGWSPVVSMDEQLRAMARK